MTICYDTTCHATSVYPWSDMLCYWRSSTKRSGLCQPRSNIFTVKWASNFSLVAPCPHVNSSNFNHTVQTLTNQKRWAQGIQKPIKKTSQSRLDVTQFTEYVKKWKLTKNIASMMFSAHATTDPGVISLRTLIHNTPQDWVWKLINSNSEKWTDW